MNKSKTIYIAAAILFAITPFRMMATDILSDPGIRDGERASYRVIERKDKEEKEEILWQSIAREIKDRVPLYSIAINSNDQKINLQLRQRDLQPLSRKVTDQAHGNSISSSTTVEKIRPLGRDEIFLLNMGDLMIQLRAYPFSKPRALKIVLPGQAPDEEGMVMSIDLIKTETVEAAGKKIRAHRLELAVKMKGAMSLFSGLIPKTSFWYTEATPHYLVKYEGAAGFGGNGERVMELIEYQEGD